MNEMKNKIIVKMETYECEELNNIIIFYLTDNFNVTKDSENTQNISYYVNRIISYYNNTFYYETFKSIQAFKAKYNLDNSELSDLHMEPEELTAPEDHIDDTATEPASPVFEPILQVKEQVSDDTTDTTDTTDVSIKQEYIEPTFEQPTQQSIEEPIEPEVKEEYVNIEPTFEQPTQQSIEEPIEPEVKEEYVNIEHANMNNDPIIKKGKSRKNKKANESDSEVSVKKVKKVKSETSEPKKVRKTKTEKKTTSENTSESVSDDNIDNVSLVDSGIESASETDTLKKVKKTRSVKKTAVEVVKCTGVYKNGNKCNNNAKHEGYCGVHLKAH